MPEAMLALEAKNEFPLVPPIAVIPLFIAKPVNAAAITGPSVCICCTMYVSESRIVLNVPPIILSPRAKSDSMISHASFSLLYRPRRVSDNVSCIL